MSIDKANHGGETLVRPPTHPVPQLQKPFEESMVESVDDQADQEVPMDAMARRTILLEGTRYERVIAGRWRQKPGEKYHPLWKLVAQMSFGMHLLAENMAISEEEVMRILQSHVDDIDGFLERTTEDFDLAQSDIHERIRCLKLPLSHVEVFDRMLEDRVFRASILDGNEKIDHVISRTKRAAKDALKDVQKGFDATNVLEKYLTKLNSAWTRESPEHEAVLVAMLGNAEGWRRAFLELHLQGNKLTGSLKKLAEVVAEMERRAAIVSRNQVVRLIRVDTIKRHANTSRHELKNRDILVPRRAIMPIRRVAQSLARSRCRLSLGVIIGRRTHLTALRCLDFQVDLIVATILVEEPPRIPLSGLDRVLQRLRKGLPNKTFNPSLLRSAPKVPTSPVRRMITISNAA